MKRVIDLILGIVLFVVLFPVLLIVAFLVRVMLGSPVLFRQTRPGRNARPFELIKFRTMTDENCCPIHKGCPRLAVCYVRQVWMNSPSYGMYSKAI
jgi:lipopolysaccharide/colanic/teichoic acid biosynthesis glycosyltransferase